MMTAQEIVRRYVNLCRAHNYEPAQTLVLEQWIAEALKAAELDTLMAGARYRLTQTSRERQDNNG